MKNNTFTDQKWQMQTRTKCTVYTRVMGFCRPVSHFNIGKKSEFYSRKVFCPTKSLNAKFNEQYK